MKRDITQFIHVGEVEQRVNPQNSYMHNLVSTQDISSLIVDLKDQNKVLREQNLLIQQQAQMSMQMVTALLTNVAITQDSTVEQGSFIGGILKFVIFSALVIWLLLGLLGFGWNPFISFQSGFEKVKPNVVNFVDTTKEMINNSDKLQSGSDTKGITVCVGKETCVGDGVKQQVDGNDVKK